MNMYRTFALACLLATAASAAAQPAGTLQKIRDANTITLGVRDASIPFSFLDDKQEAVGYSVDLCMKVVEAARRELKLPGLQLKKQIVTSSNRIPLIANGTVDLECGSTVNNLERQKLVAFSLTTFVVNTKFIVPKAGGVKRLQDLKGRTVAATSGTNTMQKLNEINSKMSLGMTLLPGKDHGESFLLVQTGRAAAFAEDDILLAGLAANSKNPKDYQLVAIEGMASDPYALMMRRDDPQFKALVDKTIGGVMKSGEIHKLYAKWFTTPIPPKGVNINFPETQAIKDAFATPNDKGV